MEIIKIRNKNSLSITIARNIVRVSQLNRLQHLSITHMYVCMHMVGALIQNFSINSDHICQSSAS